jgi:hypothetical protein
MERLDPLATLSFNRYLSAISPFTHNVTIIMKKLLATSIIMSLFVFFFVPGCSEDTTAPPPDPVDFTVSASSASVAPGGSIDVTLSGGTAPYSVIADCDTIFAMATLTGSTLNIHGMDGGFTTVKVGDAASATATISISVTGPITVDLFPIVSGRKFTFDGYAIATSGGTLPDPSNVYNTVWTIGPPGPLPGSTVIVDSTTLQHPSAGVITVAKNLLLVKNPATGEFFFAQTLGPFFRAFGINRTDTVRIVSIAKPEVGIGGTWVSFDSTYVSGAGSDVRLEINGVVEGGEVVTDSSAARDKWETVRFRTWRRISVNGAVVVDNATTSRIWLHNEVGPIQVLIAQDTENLGHMRTFKAKNF